MNRYLTVLVVMMFLGITLSPGVTQAEEKNEDEYKSEASITFSSDRSATTEESKNIPSGEKPIKQKNDKGETVKESGCPLPDTATDLPLFILIGSIMFMIGLGLMLFMLFRKKTDDEEQAE